MASYRRPKGVYTRGTPDWNYSRVATAGVYIDNGITQKFDEVGLYNNATDGSALFVHNIIYSTDFNNAVAVAMPISAQGTVIQNGFSIDTNIGQLPGQLRHNVALAARSDNFSFLPDTAAPGFLTGEFPHFIVRPGYQLIISNANVGSQVFTLCMWWTVLPF